MGAVNVTAKIHPQQAAALVADDQAFRVAELIAQFVLSEAHEYEHLEAVHDAIVEVARKIRTADWIPPETT